MDGADHHDIGVRYGGTIAGLHELVTMLEAADMPTSLVPGPAGDVTVAVTTSHLGDGHHLLAELLDDWGASHADDSASLLPLI